MGQIRTRHLKKLLLRHPDFHCPVYIETGLHRGKRMALCAPHFVAAHGIELDDHWYAVSVERTKSLPHVEIHHGDTRELLPEVLGRYPETSCFIHLDAHFCQTDPPIRKSEFPLWEELTLIRDRRVRDIVSVDDVHTFGKRREELKYSPDALEWEVVTERNILEFFGDRVYDHRTVADAFVIWKLPKGDHPPRPRRRPWWRFGAGA
jgi:hypothetical protein